MSSSTIKAEVRATVGSRDARRTRALGRIPAVIQGGDGAHLNISVDEAEFWSARRQHVHLFDIEIDGKSEPVTVRELQWDSMGDHIDHVEFLRVQLGVAVEVEVALEFVGQPKGGVLNHLASTIEVRCLPSLIPDWIEVEVDELESGHTMTAGEVPLPEGFELVSPAALPVCNVVVARGLDEETPAEGVEDAAADAPAGTPGGAAPSTEG
jgi:large subunit ribosomal protein L25